MTTVPLWISPREYIGVPAGTRAVWPSGEQFVIVQPPDGSVWLVWAGTGNALRFPDSSAADVVSMYFDGARAG